MRIGVVIPTVTGREEFFARAAMSHTADPEIEWMLSAPRNHATCATAWTEGVDALLGHAFPPDYVLISADDFTVARIDMQDYWRGAVTLCDAGFIACPILYNRDEDDPWQSSLDDGVPGGPARCTRSPNLFTREQARKVFSIFRELEPVQYYGDFLLGDIGSRLGYEARIADSFRFRHWWAQVGRHSDAANEDDHDRYQRSLLRLDHMPLEYITGDASL